MLKKGSKRKLKIKNGKVIDHRPINSKEDWPIHEVPHDLKTSYNSMIHAGSLTVNADSSITWPTEEEHQAALAAVETAREIEPNPKDVLLEALAERAGLSSSDLARARQSLINKRKTPA